MTDAPFGSDRFIAVLKDGRFDAVGLRGAEVGDYKSPTYDMPAAGGGQHCSMPKLVFAGGARARGMVITSTVFEPDEGQGTRARRLVQPLRHGQGPHRQSGFPQATAEAAGLPEVIQFDHPPTPSGRGRSASSSAWS